MRKALIALLAIGALVAGSLAVAAANPLGIAGAQDPAQDEEVLAEPTHQKRPMILDEALAGLVADGTITQAQADAVKDRVRTTADATRGEGGRPGHPGGPEGPHGPGGRGLDAVAEAIGVDVEALREGLSGGQTIAEISQANGVDPQAVIDALVAAGNQRIDEAVANGRIDEARAAEMKAGLVDKVTAMVNGEGSGGRGPGSFGPGERPMPGGPDGDSPHQPAPGDAPADDDSDGDAQPSDADESGDGDDATTDTEDDD